MVSHVQGVHIAHGARSHAGPSVVRVAVGCLGERSVKGLGSHCKAKTIGRGSSNEKSPFLLLPNQTKLAVPYDVKRSCIIVLMLPVRPRRYQGGLYNSIQTICLVLFFISDTECGVKK